MGDKDHLNIPSDAAPEHSADWRGLPRGEWRLAALVGALLAALTPLAMIGYRPEYPLPGYGFEATIEYPAEAKREMAILGNDPFLHIVLESMGVSAHKFYEASDPLQKFRENLIVEPKSEGTYRIAYGDVDLGVAHAATTTIIALFTALTDESNVEMRSRFRENWLRYQQSLKRRLQTDNPVMSATERRKTEKLIADLDLAIESLERLPRHAADLRVEFRLFFGRPPRHLLIPLAALTAFTLPYLVVLARSFRRTRLRFGLRILFVLTLVISVSLGWTRLLWTYFGWFA